jgi:hypothetical protein
MPLSIQSLNGDSTFLLTYHNPNISCSLESSSDIDSCPSSSGHFTLLLDPWLGSDAKGLHARFSNQTQTLRPHVSDLRDLPSPPNAVLASQGKSDHTNKKTLQQLDWKSTKLYAVPDAAKLINSSSSWSSWFPSGSLVTLSNQPTRIPLDTRSGDESYVELSYLPPKYPWDTPSRHSACGIKFVSSAGKETVSVLFTPHGSPLSAVERWLDGLKDRRLDVLLHPWNRVKRPLWLGGVISSGFSDGRAICKYSKVGTWVSTHDAKKIETGFVKSWLKTRVYGSNEVHMHLQEPGTDVVNLGVGEVYDLACN